MNSNTITLTLNGKEYQLIGTAHVSKGSIEEVKNYICEEKPDLVCVELDEGRYDAIIKNDNWERLNISKVFKERKGFLLIANLVMASFQKRLGNELGVKPGEEMKVAIETAEALSIPYALCDRQVHTTLRRAWASCGFWSKCKLLATLIASAFTTEKLGEEEIEELKNKNEIDSMMQEIAEYLPGVKTTLIDERDRYLAAKIWESSNKNESCKKIAAVIGAGHMNGIASYLEKFAAEENNKEQENTEAVSLTDVKQLDTIPPPKFFSRISKFIIPAAIITLIAAGFINSGKEVGFSMIKYWLLWNGSLAAIGSVIALGHPVTILISFIGAPVTSLNPFIGVGIVAGLVQAAIVKPRVIDAQNISDDGVSLKGWYRNRITRALLVFIFSSIGSSIGTFVSIPVIARLFGAE